MCFLSFAYAIRWCPYVIDTHFRIADTVNQAILHQLNTEGTIKRCKSIKNKISDI